MPLASAMDFAPWRSRISTIRLRNIIEGFVPRDALPSRIRSAFGPRASEWIIEPVLIVDKLRRGFTFDAYHAAVGMIMIRHRAESPGHSRPSRSSRSAPCRARSSRGLRGTFERDQPLELTKR